jgi:cation diffusion facilitator family transporter
MAASGKSYLKARLPFVVVSFAVGALLMAVKFYAYRLTGSSAILSDALESIINVVASGFAIASILIAAKPPDADHPYGHGKVEYFSAGFEGALIILAAFGIFKTGLSHILDPQVLPHLSQGLILLLVAGLVNLVLGLGLIRAGKKHNSLVLTADGKHLLTDVYTSAGVLVGLWLVGLTGLYWLDGVIACAVGLNILVTGGLLVAQSVSGLMDRSSPELVAQMVELLQRHRKDCWIDIHELRDWRSGSHVYIDFHLILPRYLSLEEAHREGKELEEIIGRHFQAAAGVMIHLDPCIEDDCPVCPESDCNYRDGDFTKRPPFTCQSLTAKGWGGERLSRLAQNGRKNTADIEPPE